MSAMIGLRIAVVAVLLVPAACGSDSEKLPVGCAGSPGQPRTAVGDAQVTWSAPLGKGRRTAIFDRAAIGPLLYVATSAQVEGISGENDNRVTAYHLDDGRVAWSQKGVLGRFDGSVYFSSIDGNTLVAADPQSGKWRWVHRADNGRGDAPIGSGGMQSTSDSGGFVVYRGGESPGYLARVDPADGTPLWTLTDPPPMIRQALLAGDTLYLDWYVGLEDFHISALDVGTGQVRWDRTVTEPWEIRTQGGLLAVIVDSEVLDGPPNLVMIDSGTGRTLWSHVLGDYVDSFEDTYAEFPVAGFLHSSAGVVTMYGPRTGTVRWKIDTKPDPENKKRNRSHAPGLIRLAAGGVLVTGDDYVSCVDPDTGAERWRASTGVAFINDVNVAGDTVYASGLRAPLGEDYSPVSYVQALDLRTGGPLWRYERSGTPMDLLAATPDAIFVATASAIQRIAPRR